MGYAQTRMNIAAGFSYGGNYVVSGCLTSMVLKETEGSFSIQPRTRLRYSILEHRPIGLSGLVSFGYHLSPS